MDRERELSALQESWEKEGFDFVVIYGRRRVGKTELIKEFLRDKPSIYLLCSQRKIPYNLRRFSEKVSRFLGIPEVTFSSFQDAFRAIARKGKVAVVIDEFGYLVRDDPGILSDFQEIVDDIIRESEVLLILCGSSISLMETRVLGHGSPLYGRASKYLKVGPFTLRQLTSWFPDASPEDLLRIYGVTGGVAKYLEFFSGRDVEREIVRNFFDSSAFLFSDAMKLLSDELRDYTTYAQILEAISLGYNRVSEIADYAFLKPKDVFFYLKVLSSLGLVRRVVPLFSPRRSRRGIYEIADNYFDFWFAFISPFQAEIEANIVEPALENFRSRFNSYLGRVLERAAPGLLADRLPFRPSLMGRWWRKDLEIDLVACDRREAVAFFEVKWSRLRREEALRTLRKLERVSEHVEHPKVRKRYFGLLAREVQGKEELLDGGYLVFELRELLSDRVRRHQS